MFSFCLVLLLPWLALAQDSIRTFQTLPYVDGPVSDTGTYIEVLYKISIALAAFLVIFKVIVAGAKLTFTDSISARSEAKNDILGAVIGMLIILGAVTILNTINPNLVNLKFLSNAEPILINPVDGNETGTINTTGEINFGPGQEVYLDQLAQGDYGKYLESCTKKVGVPGQGRNMVGWTNRLTCDQP